MTKEKKPVSIEERRNKLIDKLEVDTSKPHYVSVKDKSVYYRPETTSNDLFSNDIKKTITDWNEKGYTLFKGKKYSDLPLKIYIRYIIKDGDTLKARNGGVIVSNNPTDKYFYLRGFGGRGFPVQFKNIYQLYVSKEQIKNQKAKAKLKPKKKEPEEEVKEEESETEEEKEPPKEKPLTLEEIEKILHEYYYDKQNYVGRDRLHKIVNQAGHKITRRHVENFLKKQELYQLTKPSKQRKTFVPIVAKEAFNVVQMDLFSYEQEVIFLNAVDVFSKFAVSVIIPNKSAGVVISAVRKMLKKFPQKIKLLQSDNGSEFKNAKMASFLEKEGIKQIFSTAETPQSNGVVERFNGTMKKWLNKLILEKQKISQTVINRFIKNYNHSHHSTINMTPMEATKSENNEAVLKSTRKRKGANLETQNKNDLEIGDKVRITNEKKHKFESLITNWSKEIFTISNISISKDLLKPTKYKIKDDDGEVIKGYFFRNELQKIE